MKSIRVFCGSYAVDLVDEQHAEHMARGENVTVIRRRRDRKIVQINVENHGECFSMKPQRGNPRRYSHDHETRDNPPRVWTIRRLGSKDPDAEKFVQRIFRASVLDNLKKAA